MKTTHISLLFTVFALSLSTLVLATQSLVAEDAVVYKMKGIIRALPGNGRAQNEVLIRHEAVPDYRDSAGKVVGMAAMTMPFYLRAGVDLGDLKVGDPVVFSVEAHWEPRFTEEVTSISRAS